MKNQENLKVTISHFDVKSTIETMMRGGLSPLRVAVEAGVKSRDLLDWIERDMALDPEALSRLNGWCEDEAQAVAQAQEGAAASREPGFVETPTARRIIEVLDYARYAPCIAVIYGGAGVGKTTTLNHYADTRRRTWTVTAAQALRTTSAILMELVEEHTERRGFPYRVDSLFKEALTMMRRGEFESINSLLLVDEAQHLDTPTFDAIRALHDMAGIGIVYVGNEEVYSRIYGKKKSRLPQIYSRVGKRLHIEHSAPEDADAILEAHGITGREERRYAQMIAATPGGLRQLSGLIRDCKFLTADSRAPITLDMLQEAAKDCGFLL
jgi:DNA transposition AAA+ family ATPase